MRASEKQGRGGRGEEVKCEVARREKTREDEGKEKGRARGREERSRGERKGEKFANFLGEEKLDYEI